jgi:hypothetical protein
MDEIDFKVKLNTIFDKKFLNESKSFLRGEGPAALHRTDLVFERSPPDNLKKSTEGLNTQNKKKPIPKKGRNQLRRIEEREKSIADEERELSTRERQRDKGQLATLTHKKSLSIYHSNIGSPHQPGSNL